MFKKIFFLTFVISISHQGLGMNKETDFKETTKKNFDLLTKKNVFIVCNTLISLLPRLTHKEKRYEILGVLNGIITAQKTDTTLNKEVLSALHQYKETKDSPMYDTVKQQFIKQTEVLLKSWKNPVETYKEAEEIYKKYKIDNPFDQETM